MIKLTQVNTKSNWDEIRKEQMRQILEQGPNMSDDDVVYLRHCIKNYSGPTAFLWLETHLKDNEINQLIKKMKVVNQEDNSNDIYLVQEGELKSKTRIYRKSDVVSNEQVIFMPGSSAFQLSRELFNEFRNSQEMKDFHNKSTAITRCIPIRTLDLKQKQTLLSHFQEKSKQFGSIITVPNGGTSNLFLLTSGCVAIFTQLKQKIAIVGFLKGNGAFNEQKILFGNQSQYGAMVVMDSTLYTITQQDATHLPDECLQYLRGEFQAKQRIYENYLQKIENDFENNQSKLCSKYNVKYDDIISVIQKNTKDGKIESTDKQEQIEKNKKLFEKTVGNNPLKNALSNMTDREKTLCMGTPRIANRQSNFLGLTNEQETSLFALRQLGMNMRKGVQTTNQINPMPKDEVQKAKQVLLQQEKQELLQRKSISQKLTLKELSEEKTIQKKVEKDEIQSQSQEQQQEEQQQEKKQQECSQKMEVEIEKNVSAEFTGRNQQRQGSFKNQSAKLMEIDKKRKGLMKLGI